MGQLDRIRQKNEIDTWTTSELQKCQTLQQVQQILTTAEQHGWTGIGHTKPTTLNEHTLYELHNYISSYASQIFTPETLREESPSNIGIAMAKNFMADLAESILQETRKIDLNMKQTTDTQTRLAQQQKQAHLREYPMEIFDFLELIKIAIGNHTIATLRTTPPSSTIIR